MYIIAPCQVANDNTLGLIFYLLDNNGMLSAFISIVSMRRF